MDALLQLEPTEVLGGSNAFHDHFLYGVVFLFDNGELIYSPKGLCDLGYVS